MTRFKAFLPLYYSLRGRINFIFEIENIASTFENFSDALLYFANIKDKTKLKFRSDLMIDSNRETKYLAFVLYELYKSVPLNDAKDTCEYCWRVDCINVFNPDLYSFDREKFGIPKEKLVIIYSGTISKSKGVHNIIRVAENIPKELLKEILFLIVGDGPYLNEMKINIKKLGLSNSFYFTGFIPREEIPKYLKLANLGIVSPSPIRGGLIKLAEYMAMEIIPIVPPNSWPTEHIKHGINGFVARIEEYSDILNKLNKEQIYEMSKEARIYAINNFDIRNVAKRLINYLSENGH